jgi:hypothetical protein
MLFYLLALLLALLAFLLDFHALLLSKVGFEFNHLNVSCTLGDLFFLMFEDFLFLVDMNMFMKMLLR